jgi:hypothetical protein
MISYLKCDYLEKNGLAALYINMINAVAKGLNFFVLCYLPFNTVVLLQAMCNVCTRF